MIPRELVVAGYDKIGTDCHEHRIQREPAFNEWLKEETKRFHGIAGAFLDVGCGGGRPIAKFFADHGFQVTGLDISPKMIELAKSSVPSAQFFVQDMETMSFPESFYDAIFCSWAIIHVPRDRHKGIIEKLFRFLKPNGVLWIIMGNEDAESILVPDWKGAPMYWSYFDRFTNRKMLEDVGFQIEIDEISGSPGDQKVLFRATKP